MRHSDFYVFIPDFKRGALNLIPSFKEDCFKLFKNILLPENELIFSPGIGSNLYDVLNSGYAGLNLVSVKVIELLKSNNISGWNAIPAIIRRFEQEKYYVLSVSGKCKHIDYSKSELFFKKPYTSTGRAIKAKRGLFFDLESWDGSEIFSPEESMFTFVTKEVMQLFKRNKVTNVHFENVTKFEII